MNRWRLVTESANSMIWVSSHMSVSATLPVVGERLKLAQNRYVWRYWEGADIIIADVQDIVDETRTSQSVFLKDICGLCAVRIVAKAAGV